MKYSIVKFKGPFGDSHYKVKIHDASGDHWLEDKWANVLEFYDRSEAHVYVAQHAASVGETVVIPSAPKVEQFR